MPALPPEPTDFHIVITPDTKVLEQTLNVVARMFSNIAEQMWKAADQLGKIRLDNE